MSSQSHSRATTDSADRELVFTKVLNAPRELVFSVWTDPDHVAKWWGPNGFTLTTKEMDAKPGGVWRFTMHGPDGRDYPNKIVFLEVVRPEKLSYKHSDDDPSLEPIDFHVTVVFKELKPNQTELTMHSVFPSAEALQRVVREHGAIEGAHQHMARLTEYVTTMPFIIERTFQAPAEKVWKAITDKDEMKKWYFDLADFKPVVGFEFRFYGGTDQKQYLHICKITEVIAGKKLTSSWRYDGYEGISYVSFELFAEGSQTKLRLTHTGLETFPSDNPDFAKKNFAEGWTSIIGTSLKDFLESDSN